MTQRTGDTATSAATASTAAAELTTRLDRLHFTRAHLHLLNSSGSGWAFDALDVALISYVIVVLREQWALSASDTGWIVSLGFVGMAIGAVVGGRLADRFGRRTIFAVTLLIFGIGSALAAFAPGLAVLLVLRVIIGFGLGAELPVASTYVSEFAPPSIRGRIVVILEAFWAVGWLAAALLGFLLVPQGEWGWRIAFLVGALPALYAAFVRAKLPESVRFLLNRGRIEEARTVVERFENSHVVFRLSSAADTAKAADAGAATSPNASETQAADAGATAPHPTTQRTRFADLWRAGQIRSTVSLSLVWFFVNFSYYGAFIWLPTLLKAQGFSIVSSFGYTLLMTLAQLPGYLVAAWLIEHWGRRTTLAVFLAGSAASAIAFGTAGSLPVLLIAGSLLSFFNLGAWGALYAISPEVFPTRLRGSGTGWAAGFGRIASIVAPLLVPVLLVQIGVPWLFVIFAVSFVIAAVAALFLNELKGRTLHD